MSRLLNVTNCHVARVNDNRDMSTQENYLLDRIHALQREVGRLTRENDKYREIIQSVSRIVFTDKEPS